MSRAVAFFYSLKRSNLFDTKGNSVRSVDSKTSKRRRVTTNLTVRDRRGFPFNSRDRGLGHDDQGCGGKTDAANANQLLTTFLYLANNRRTSRLVYPSNRNWGSVQTNESTFTDIDFLTVQVKCLKDWFLPMGNRCASFIRLPSQRTSGSGTTTSVLFVGVG